MNKLAKGFLSVLAGIAAILVLAVLWVTLYIESEGVQARLELALRDELHMPVKLSQVHFSWTGGLRVVGVTVPEAEPAVTPSSPESSRKEGAAPQNFFDAPEVSVRILLKPLLSHRLVINELLISQPTVVWMQTPSGKWRLPVAGLSAQTTQPGSEFPAAPRPNRSPSPSLGEAGQPGSVAPGGPAAAQPEAPKELEFKIVAARIENGTFRFLSRQGEPIAVFEGVTVRCPSVAVGEVRGSATIRRVTYAGGVTAEGVSALFSFSNGRLELQQIDARVAGGSIRGSYTLEPTREGSPFTLDLLFDGVNVDDLLSQVDAGMKATGSLQGSLDVYGMHAEENSLGGRGEVVLRNGRMEQYPLLQMIGQALQIDELTRLDLQQAQLDLRLGQGKAFVDSLVLESPSVSLLANGATELDGNHLDLAASLSIDPKVGRQLPNWVASNFQPVPGSDRRIIHFGVSGTVQKPKTDLMRVMVGQKIEKPMIELLKFLNGGRHKKKAEPPVEAPPTPPAETQPQAPAPAAAQPTPVVTPTPAPAS